MLVVVVVIGSFVRLFVYSCFHVFVCGGYCVLCRCVVASCCAVLCRPLCLWCLRRCVLYVVMCRCLFMSDVRFLDLLRKTNYRERSGTVVVFYHEAADW